MKPRAAAAFPDVWDALSFVSKKARRPPGKPRVGRGTQTSGRPPDVRAVRSPTSCGGGPWLAGATHAISAGSQMTEAERLPLSWPAPKDMACALHLAGGPKPGQSSDCRCQPGSRASAGDPGKGSYPLWRDARKAPPRIPRGPPASVCSSRSSRPCRWATRSAGPAPDVRLPQTSGFPRCSAGPGVRAAVQGPCAAILGAAAPRLLI